MGAIFTDCTPFGNFQIYERLCPLKMWAGYLHRLHALMTNY